MITAYIQKKGYSYEDFVCNNLLQEYDQVYKFKDTPEYIIAKTKLFNDVKLYEKYKNCDIGADLVATKNDQVYFIQCKNYDNVISIDNLCSFYFLLFEFELNGVLVYNGQLSERITELKQNRVSYINLPYNNTILDINFLNKETEKINPRDYQIEICNNFKTINKGVIALPCGMGKTYTSWLIGKDYSNIIILSPTRCLAESNLVNMYKYSSNSYNPILISMDGSRDVKHICEIMKDKNIFSVTYDSCDIFIDIIAKLSNYILIVDEFHNLSYTNLNKPKDSINKLLNNKCKTIYLSATPINNSELFGTYIYKYDWNKAIENKYICDFKVILPEDFNEENKIFNDFLKSVEYDNKDKNLIIKLFYLFKGIKFYGNKKTIIYVSGVKEAIKYNNIIIWLQKLFNINIETNQIDYKTSKLKRKEYINKFKFNENIQILLNVQILNEGIDIPECDSIFITNPTENIINLVQRMCRCNRILPNKTKCFIYLWSDKQIMNTINNYLNTDSIIKNKTEFFNINRNNNETKTNENKETNSLNVKYEHKNDDFFNYLRTENKTTDFVNMSMSYFEVFKLNINDIIKEDYIERYAEFLIDSEILRKWLQINNRRKFNDTIKRSYKKNVDYKIEKVKNAEGSGGHNLEQITLTPEAAKKICLSTNSKMGPLVQQYFLDLEVALYKYKNYIIDGMAKKIAQLENNQKPKINSTKKIIYVFRALNTDLTLYKIGKTINSKSRFSKHNSPLANDLEVIFQYETENINQVESCIKSYMKQSQYRKYKEIYQVDLKIIKKAIKDCDGKINEYNTDIVKYNKKQKAGTSIKKQIEENEILYMLLPLNNE